MADEELAKKFNWWWRGLFEKKYPTDPQSWNPSEVYARLPPGRVWTPNDVGETFRSSYATSEHSAYLYELGKRITGKYEFEQPWIKLGKKERRFLAARWPDPQGNQDNWQTSGPNLPLPGPDWTNRECISFNLRRNNNTLVKAFLRYIEMQRRYLDIPNPPANAGVKRKPKSWLPIEMFDIRDYNIQENRVIVDVNYSLISKAEQFYQEHLAIVDGKS